MFWVSQNREVGNDVHVHESGRVRDLNHGGDGFVSACVAARGFAEVSLFTSMGREY
jgi:hypothetical protein